MCWMAVSGVTHLVVEGAALCASPLTSKRQTIHNEYHHVAGNAVGAVVLDASFYKSTSGNILMEICALSATPAHGAA